MGAGWRRVLPLRLCRTSEPPPASIFEKKKMRGMGRTKTKQRRGGAGACRPSHQVATYVPIPGRPPRPIFIGYGQEGGRIQACSAVEEAEWGLVVFELRPPDPTFRLRDAEICVERESMWVGELGARVATRAGFC